MSGTRGPIPKRSEARRRTNAPAIPTEIVNITDLVRRDVEVPEPDAAWHPVAQMVWASLVQSGQAVYYEPSDWATAYLLCESLSRDLQPQFVGIHERTGDPVHEAIPLKGASLAAYLKGFSVLMMTEGDRRRLSVELERNRGGATQEPAEVADIAATRRSKVGS